jgi:SAM-dependent methyltransferase
MAEFWDARADEDAFYFVDDRMHYGDADRERFWEGGREALDLIGEELAVAVSPTDDVVEIGCGIGRITRVLAERGRSVRAVDVSERMLAKARELNNELANVEWILGDGVSLQPIEDGSVDVCHSLVVFHHIPDPEVTLGYVAEMGRVLRPGGWAGFQLSNDPSAHRPSARRERLALAARSALRRGPRGREHPAWRGSAVDLGELDSVAQRAGMRTERVVREGTLFCLVLLRKEG